MPVVVLPAGNNTYTPIPPDADYTVSQTPPSDGNNTVTLGNGTDQVTFADGNNTLTLGDGTDQVNLGNGGNTVTTGNGNSAVTVGNGNNTITAGTGSNTIMLGTGVDIVSTNAGNNTVSVAGSAISADTIHGALSTGDGSTNKLVLTSPGPAMAPVSVYGFQSFQLANGGPNGLTLSEGNFTNLPGGSITVMGGNSGNIVNAAALSAAHSVVIYGGAGTDVFTGGAGNDRFIFAPSNLSGDTVSGGGGINTLELQAGSSTGEVTGLGGPSFSGLGVVDVDAAADWLFTSTQAVTDTINLAAGATGEFSGAMSSGQTVAFNAATGTLKIDSASQFTSQINGFQIDDVIDLTAVPFDSGGSATLESGNVLKVVENGQTYNLQLNPTQNFAGLEFALSTDGANGSDITLQNPPNLSYVGLGNLTGNGQDAVMWQSGGSAVLWNNTNGAFVQATVPGAMAGPEWTAVGTGSDAQGTEMFWQNGSGGQLAIWQFAGGALSNVVVPSGKMSPDWHVAALGDFNGDGSTDVLWETSAGAAYLWQMNGTTTTATMSLSQPIPAGWSITGVGNFFGTGNDSLLLEGPNGMLQSWSMNGASVGQMTTVGQFGPGWTVGGVGNFGSDGAVDVVAVNSTSNNVELWNMQNGQIAQFITPSMASPGTQWHLQAVGDFNGSGVSQLLWMTQAGATQLWQFNGTQVTVTSPTSPSGDTLQFAPASTIPSGNSPSQLFGSTDTAVGFGDSGAASAGAPGSTSGSSGANPTPAAANAIPPTGAYAVIGISHDATLFGV